MLSIELMLSKMKVKNIGDKKMEPECDRAQGKAFFPLGLSAVIIWYGRGGKENLGIWGKKGDRP
ncbi:hypothetical protein [Kamptonema sp. UHCC 0994]|uniref:hypothetical protein n=1 Tax=Kamptonema sp. UHCC 0994 TaxID=3031329 RepID=UPI0023B9178B|nr:hypothetical protein [Kamptonema sp. UHCC 0994]MDF0555609.1 hypothetical protein [Kamptonema sp. UHCC 0994]